MERIRNDEWKLDGNLSNELQRLTNEGFTNKEILSFMTRDFSEYAWSERTLVRRKNFFNLCRSDNYSDELQVTEAIKEELKGPGKLLGIRTMQKKLNQVHQLRMPRDVVNCIMGVLDPSGLEARKPVLKKKKIKGNFISPGPNYVHSLDGHDKLMGFQNWTFPLAIYGSIDTCSRKILWIKVWTTNSDPKYPALWYYQYLKKSKIIARHLRIDKGTETVDMTCFHAITIQHITGISEEEAADSVLYGPSTSNQIERWWRELHEKLEIFYKDILLRLKNDLHYDPHNQVDRNLLAYIMIPLLEEEIAVFVKIHNTHRIRKQDGVILPNGIPEHIFNFPEEYGLEECGFQVTDSELDSVKANAPMADENESYVDNDFADACRQLYHENITNTTIYGAFVTLKERLKNNNLFYS